MEKRGWKVNWHAFRMFPQGGLRVNSFIDLYIASRSIQSILHRYNRLSEKMMARLKGTDVIRGPAHTSTKVSRVESHFNSLVGPLYVTRGQARARRDKGNAIARADRFMISHSNIDLYHSSTLAFLSRASSSCGLSKTTTLQSLYCTPRLLRIATRDLAEDSHYIDTHYVLSNAVRREIRERSCNER